MSRQALSVWTAVLLVATLAWAFRWQAVAVPAGGETAQPAMYLVNRWTGEIVYCQRMICEPAER